MDAVQAISDLLNKLPADVLRLAQLVSFAALAEPGLIRQMRLTFLPDSDAGIEADVWFLPIVQHAGCDGIVFHPQAAEELRRRLADQDMETYEAAWAQTEKAHRTLTPALRLEEEVGYLLHSRRDDRQQRMEYLFRSAVAALRDPTRTGLANWAARALPRLPAEIRATEGARMLAAGATLRLPQSLTSVRLIPPNEVAEWAWLAPKDVPIVRLGVRFYQDVLEIGPIREIPMAAVIDVPKTDPLILDVAFRGARRLAREESDTAAETEAKPAEPKVYISFAAEGGRLAKLVYECLMHAEVQTFLGSFSTQGLISVSEVTKASIRNADIFIAIVTPSSDNLSFSGIELDYAIEAGTPVIFSLLFEGAKPEDLTPPLTQFEAVVMDPSIENDFFEMKKTILGAVTKALAFQTFQFKEGKMRRWFARGDRVRLRMVTGDEFELVTVEAALQDAITEGANDERRQVKAITKLASRLTGASLEKALEFADGINDVALRIEMLTVLVRRLDGDTRDGTINLLFRSVAKLDDTQKIDALDGVAQYLAEKNLEYYFHALMSTVPGNAQKLAATSKLLPYFPPELAEGALAYIGMGEVDLSWRLWPLGKKWAHDSQGVNAVAMTPDAAQIVSASERLKVWQIDQESQEPAGTAYGSDILSLAVTGDGLRAVLGLENGFVVVCDLETGKSLLEFEGHTAAVEAVAVAPDGTWAISGSLDKTLMIWSLTDGKNLRRLSGHAGGVTSLAVSRDGRYAVSGSEDNTVMAWDITAGVLLRPFPGHSATVTSLAVTPEGRHIISSSEDGTLKIWDIDTGEGLTLSRDRGVVNCIASAGIGRWLISGGDDQMIRVWDLISRTEVATFDTSSAVTACAASPDGITFVAAVSTGDIYVVRLGAVWERKKKETPQEKRRAAVKK